MLDNFIKLYKKDKEIDDFIMELRKESSDLWKDCKYRFIRDIIKQFKYSMLLVDNNVSMNFEITDEVLKYQDLFVEICFKLFNIHVVFDMDENYMTLTQN